MTDVETVTDFIWGVGGPPKWLQMVILLAGSLIVIYIGVGLFRSKVEELERSNAEASIPKTIYSACVVTWFNPQAIIDGTMMLGAFHVTLGAAQSTPFICGVAAASCLWFTGLTLVISLFSSRFNAKVLQTINKICGAVIIFYGGKLLFSFISML